MYKKLVFSMMIVASALPLCAQEDFEFKLQAVLGRMGVANSEREGTDLWQALQACKQKPATDESDKRCIQALGRFVKVTDAVIMQPQSNRLVCAYLADLDGEIKSWGSYLTDLPNVTIRCHK